MFSVFEEDTMISVYHKDRVFELVTVVQSDSHGIPWAFGYKSL